MINLSPVPKPFEAWAGPWTGCSVVWGTYCDLNIKYGWLSEECAEVHDLIGMRLFTLQQKSGARFKIDFSPKIQIW